MPKCLTIIHIVVFLCGFHQRATALSEKELALLRGIEDAQIFVLQKDEPNPTQIIVIAGVDDNLSDNSVTKIKGLFKSFGKIFALDCDAKTPLGQEIKNSKTQQKFNVVKDDTFIHVGNCLWTGMFLLAGCGVIYTMINYNSLPIDFPCGLALYCYEAYSSGMYRRAESRAQLMALKLAEKTGSSKFLAIVHRDLAVRLAEKLFTKSTYTLIDIPEAPQDEIQEPRASENYSDNRPLDVVKLKIDNETMQKSEAELEEAAFDKIRAYERERAQEIALERQKITDEKVQNDWHKNAMRWKKKQ